jgi:hypothetical protein
MQGFWKKYDLTEGKRGYFFQNLYNLAGQRDTELPLHNETKREFLSTAHFVTGGYLIFLSDYSF